MDDLDRAVTFLEAVRLTSNDNPDCAIYLNSLAIRSRFEIESSESDLVRAMELSERAIESTPHGHPALSMRLCILGNIWIMRFNQTDEFEALDHAITAFKKALANTTAPTYHRIIAADAALKLLLHHDPARAKPLLDTAVLS
jgi:hypothetical protein